MRLRVLTALLAALAAAFVIAPAAIASFYRAERPQYQLEFHANPHRIGGISIRVRTQCRGGTHSGIRVSSPFHVKLGSDGGFKYNGGGSGDTFNIQFVVQGKVTAEAVIGRYRAVDYEFEPRAVCWSGRSLSDPVVTFKAPRVRPALHHGRG